MKLCLPFLRHARHVFGALVFFLGTALRAQALDPAFTPNPNADVFALAAQPDGKILVGGNFTLIGGVARSRLARLNPDGTVDSTFNPSPNTTVAALLVQPDGKILVGGGFTTIAGTTRVRLARLNPNGSLDSGFTAGADGSVYSLAVQADGKILIGGLFAIVNETPRSAIARLNADGSLDAAFNLNVTGVNVGTQQQLAAIVVQPDGKILLGGNFSQVAGQPRASLARVNPDGSLDSTFNIGTGSTSDVQTIVLQPDGKILIGGSFSLFSGQIRAVSPASTRMDRSTTPRPPARAASCG